MSKIAEMKKWQAEEFAPWQQAAQKFQDKQVQNEEKLRRHATEIKTMVAHLMDGQFAAATNLWNQVGFEPVLRAVKLTDGDVLELTLQNGNVERVALDDLLADLQRVLR